MTNNFTPAKAGQQSKRLSKEEYADKMKAEGTLDPKVLNVDTKTLIYQVPGGMLSNMLSQLKQAGKEDKYYDS